VEDQTKSNDELRQNFVDMCAEQVKVLGMTIPDPQLKWNESAKHYDFGEINWDEFWNVVKGNGPCNKERMAARIKAWEDGRMGKRSSYGIRRKTSEQKATGRCLMPISSINVLNLKKFEPHLPAGR
jgi:ring-1,2-phenylacetyl-CoA epoxidase subunit PaaA